MSEPETETTAFDDALRSDETLLQSGAGSLQTAGVDFYEAKGVDQLKGEERDLYEKTRRKVLMSLLYGALSLLFLGFCAETGGKSSAFNVALKKANEKNLSTQQIDLGIKMYQYIDAAMLRLLVGGMGFAGFCHFSAFVLAVAAAILMSPFLTGSVKEMSILRGPIDFNKEVGRRKSSKSFHSIGL